MRVLKIVDALLMMGCFFLILSCNKSRSELPEQQPDSSDTGTFQLDTVYSPVSVKEAKTIGFFLNNWQPKTFALPAHSTDKQTFSGTADVDVVVDMNRVITKVSEYLFGNNSNTWMGQMVTESKLINYIKDLSPHIIRGPGGSISDIYFWNRSSAPPPDAPDSLLNADGEKIPGGYWYGKNTQSWTLSIDHYYQMLQQTNSEGLLTVNYGYARYGTGPHPVQQAAHLAADWVRYDQGRTKYWEIGNENNGDWEAGYRIDVSKNQDVQPEIITGELYGQHFKVFADSMRAAAAEIGATIYIGAQLLDKPAESWQTTTDKNWNKGVLTETGQLADFFVTHDYFTDYHTNASPDEVLETGIAVPKKIMNYVHSQFSQYGVSPKPIALTEWNIFSTGSEQMVSNIAGMHAAIVLGELIKNKFGEACRWDLANGWDNGNDMGMFNIGDEPNTSKWSPRPAFYYMYYFQRFFGDRMVTSTVSGSNDILCYASSFGEEGAGLILVNKGSTDQKINVQLNHYTIGEHFYWYLLIGGTDNAPFSRKVLVNGTGPSGLAGGPADYKTLAAYRTGINNGIRVDAPAYSVIYIKIKRK